VGSEETMGWGEGWVECVCMLTISQCCFGGIESSVVFGNVQVVIEYRCVFERGRTEWFCSLFVLVAVGRLIAGDSSVVGHP